MNVTQLQAKARMSSEMKRRFNDADFKEKHRAGLIEKLKDPEYRAKKVESAARAQKKRFAEMSDDERKNHNMKLRDATNTNESRQKRSDKMKANWANPEFAKKSQAIIDKRGTTWLENVKKGHQKRASNEEWRKNVKEAHRVYIVTPIGIFDSPELAHKSHGMSLPWLYQRFEYNPKSFYRISKELFNNLLNNEKLRIDTIKQADILYVKKKQKKKIQTPYGIFDSINSAGTYCNSIGVGGKTFVRNRLNDNSKDWYVIQGNNNE